MIEYLNIYEIRRVINNENKTAVELVIDAYLTEKDYQPEGEDMSEVAEPENGNEDEEKPDEGEETAETETKPEGEESETTE